MNKDGITALHLAAEYGNPEAITALAAARANLEAVDNRGRRPIDMARYFNHQKEAYEVLKAAE